MKSIEIREIHQVDQKLVDQVITLLPQLTPIHNLVTQATLEELVLDKNSALIGAYSEDNVLVGMLSLVVFTIPTGKKAFIEDVVVDQTARGMGLGEMILCEAIELAKSKGVKRIELSSRPSRVPANKLYQKLGFEIRETNFYRLEL